MSKDADLSPIVYQLELCDVSGEHRPVAIFRSSSPFAAVAVGDRFDDEGWPRLKKDDAPGAADAPRRYTVHSIKHVVTREGGTILSRYCLNLAPFDGGRSPIWGSSPPVAPQA
jgi:hypothetical protein